MSYLGVHICVIYGTDGGPNRIWSLALAVGFITFREGNGIALAVLIVAAFALQLLHAIHMAGGFVIPECNERPIHDCYHRIRRSAWPVAQYDDASVADP